MKYAIHAYKTLYDDLHGIYTDFVVDVNSPVEAQEEARLNLYLLWKVIHLLWILYMKLYMRYIMMKDLMKKQPMCMLKN